MTNIELQKSIERKIKAGEYIKGQAPFCSGCGYRDDKSGNENKCHCLFVGETCCATGWNRMKRGNK